MGLFVGEPLVLHTQELDTRGPDVTCQASSSANISTSITVLVFILSAAVARLNCVTSVAQLKEEFQALVR
jgi:hypothetical protein